MCLECDYYEDQSEERTWTLDYPIAVVLTRRTDPSNGSTEVVASTPQWPGLEAARSRPEQALIQLLWQVSDMRPLDDAIAEDLFAAGYNCATVNAWQQHVRGRWLSSIRHDSAAAASWLRAYEEVGVPSVEACRFLAMGLDKDSAATLHREGVTAEEADPWLRAFGTFIGYNYCGPIDVMFAEDPEHIVEWILSDLDLAPSKIYRCNGLTVAEAVEWHPVVVALEIDEEDFGDIIRAGFSPSEVVSRHADYEALDRSIGDAARTILALRA